MPLLVLVAGLVFTIDRLTKIWVTRTLAPLESVSLIPGVLDITHVRNSGAAFGLLPNHTVLLAGVSLVVAGAILFYGRQIPSPWGRLGFGLLLGGALGNLVDRVREGAVVDFIDLQVWPVFNAADSAIVVGVIMAGWYLLRGGEATGEEPA